MAVATFGMLSALDIEAETIASNVKLKGKESIVKRIDAPQHEADHIMVEARCEMKQRQSARRGKAIWTIVMTWGEKAVEIGVAADTEWADTESEHQELRVTVKESGKEYDLATLEKGVATGRGYNSLVVDAGEGIARVWLGDHVPVACGSVVVPGGVPDKVELRAAERIEVEYLLVEARENPAARLTTEWTGKDEIDIIRRVERSNDPREGVWRYLDRDVDTAFALPGGEYRLATISDNNGGYYILYLSGGQVNASRWKTGMIKGRLKPTIFADHYDMEWIDSMMEVVTGDATAGFDHSLGIMTVTMPLEKATMRYSREQ